jgi:hydroxysqualene synthase
MQTRSLAAPDDQGRGVGADAAAAAEDYCARLTRGHYENFPVAPLLVPRELRPAVQAIYAFARTADDFADEPEHEGRRLALLDAWEKMLRSAFEGRAEHPVFVALAQAAVRHRLPIRPFLDLLAAFRLDVTKTSYETWDELRDYCRLSADPVGRLMLHLFGKDDPELLPLSDALCTGLQLANHWQDVREDRARGRVYIPREAMRRHGVVDPELDAPRAGKAFAALMEELVAVARESFGKARSLPRRTGGRLGWQLRLTWLGGMRILEKIAASEGDVLARPPRLGYADAPLLAARAAAWRG